MWAFLPPETLDPEKDPDEPEPEENEGLELNFVLDWLPLQLNLPPRHLSLWFIILLYGWVSSNEANIMIFCVFIYHASLFSTKMKGSFNDEFCGAPTLAGSKLSFFLILRMERAS